METSEFPATEAPLIIIVGPTASGKSALAMEVAIRFQGEIVNCDSLQVYRYFQIGTAKPGAEDRSRVPHHLIDIREPSESFTAGDYSRMAREAIADISRRGKLPIVAGGTGFYLRALLEGLFPGPQRDDLLRYRLGSREERRPGSLHRLLRRLDPEAAQRIHEKDVNKTIRALEVRLLTGTPISQLHGRGRNRLTGYRVLQIGLNPPRDELYERIDQRARRMFEGGLIQEVISILNRNYGAGCKPFESLGYAQALEHLRGEISLEQAIASTQVETRHYAKRQLTWFRRDAGIEWYEGFGSDPAVQAHITARLEKFLHPA